MRFFLQSLEPMRQSGRLGPILIQTPPNLKADTGLLQTFAQLLPQAYRFAFEFRHESWFTDAVYEILKEQKCRPVLGGEREDCRTEDRDSGLFVLPVSRAGIQHAGPQQVVEELMKYRLSARFTPSLNMKSSRESALNAVAVARACGVEEKPFLMPEKKTREKRR